MLIAQFEQGLKDRFFVAAKRQRLRDVAAVVGVSRDTIARWLRGDTMAVTTLKKLEAWIIAQEGNEGEPHA